ncbi:uncharacterized protein K460DRAFT_289132 [Cucurbitaria berberidis CBS 394.84]|uniref:Uncharacterized protein n=1 Tax=Cucurbitaria berberidis CBS 394.84 TaxID=1168544 RepID=A0A9P4GEW4_9PLEO|nr:uncharacterized protein K460DRAFT_289132 [Cucurbitaria berberidis CBS 394.84]KAF1844352.1 hypothetical protein K460DRAFT_289132 [Cucurbitaria berberidis CBS 394.84]
MATTMAPPRTPSPKVRIRAQSFDSPSSRMTVTPIDESPCSKSTGAITSLPRHDAIKAAEQRAIQPVNVLLPLHTKMSDESIMSDASSSAASSPTDSEGNMDLCSDSPLPSPCEARQRPHPLTFCQSISYDGASAAVVEPSSPFLYQDTSYPMYSPWLVRVVLDLYDVRGLDWMSIAEPIARTWGVQTSTAEVLDILSGNGRVHNRRWWD